MMNMPKKSKKKSNVRKRASTAAVSRNGSGKYAGFWVRLGAFLVDAVFTIAAGVLIPYVGAAAALIFNIYLIYTRGYSIGKKVFNLRIEKDDGAKLDIVDVVMREILGKFVSGLVLGLGFLLIIIDDKKQGLHDKLAHTIVKQA
ncbi:RDD family protein [uncultured archaeon]|nr:RDD family protein [uncultured archaeon]